MRAEFGRGDPVGGQPAETCRVGHDRKALPVGGLLAYGHVPGAAARAGQHQVHVDRRQAHPGRGVRQHPGREVAHQAQHRRVGNRRWQADGAADVVVVHPQLERADHEQVIERKPDAVHRDPACATVSRPVTAGRSHQLQRVVGGAAPLVQGLSGGAAGLPDGRGLGRLDVLRVGYGRVAGQGAVRVVLDPG